jgi:hypothetical protein
MKYWKALIIHKGKICSNYDQSPWKNGEWRKEKEPTESCVGLNCSPRIYAAMQYVNMEVLAQVEVGGKIIKSADKLTCQNMRFVKAWKWDKKDSVALSIYAAELCIDNFEKIYPADKRPRQTIVSAKAWLENPTEENKKAAWSAAVAAWSAARSAARSAAESAAWSAEYDKLTDRLFEYLEGRA